MATGPKKVVHQRFVNFSMPRSKSVQSSASGTRDVSVEDVSEGGGIMTLPSATDNATPLIHFKDLAIVSTLKISGARLCGFCGSFYPWAPKYLHRSFEAMSASALGGCALCQMFCREVENVEGSVRSIPCIKGQFMVIFQYGPGRFQLPTTKDFEYYACPEKSHKSLLSSSLFRVIHQDPLSTACFQIAQDWIATCRKDHKLCGAKLSSGLPTRVIDLYSEKLILKSQDSAVESYVTLSYCWGTQATVTTTKETLPAHLQGIDFDDLPVTFQDAITITRKLKIRYLWIDALCIIQNSREDWVREAAKMAQYYRNSFLTISALGSSGSQTGFLGRRPASPTVLIPNSAYYVRPASASWRSVFRGSPLNHRAWALQERLLSTRTLHYGEKEMFWECLTCSARESSHDLSATEIEQDPYLRVYMDGADFKKACLDDDKNYSYSHLFNKWYSLVEEYSQRELTIITDKLPAISGLASIFQGSMLSSSQNYTYLAGIWRGDLCGLLWARMPSLDNGSADIRRRKTAYIAPSWSWASVDGPVRFFGNEPQTRPNIPELNAEIISAEVRPLSVDYLGEILSGSMTLACQIKQVQFTPSNDSGTVDVMNTEGKLIAKAYIDNPLTGHDLVMAKKTAPKQCSAIRIMETRFTGLKKGLNVLFLLVIPDEKSEYRWRRIGMGFTRDAHNDSEYQINSFKDSIRKDLTIV